MRSSLARCLLVAVITTFGVYVVAGAWGRPTELDRAAAEAWTWAFSRLAWTPAALGVVAGCAAFVFFVLSQLLGIRPREAFLGALLPYPVVLLADVIANGGHAPLPIEVATHGLYLAVPLGAWVGASIPTPGRVAEVDGRPVTRAGSVADVREALVSALREGGSVVVERFRSDDFVQFAVTPPHSIVLDLPRTPLDDDRWQRARALLEPLGARVVTDTHEALQLDVRGGASEAAELAMRVFAEVYGAGDVVEIRIEVV